MDKDRFYTYASIIAIGGAWGYTCCKIFSYTFDLFDHYHMVSKVSNSLSADLKLAVISVVTFGVFISLAAITNRAFDVLGIGVRSWISKQRAPRTINITIPPLPFFYPPDLAHPIPGPAISA